MSKYEEIIDDEKVPDLSISVGLGCVVLCVSMCLKLVLIQVCVVLIMKNIKNYSTFVGS